jgi:ABC-type sugar transport system ATPase subunit
MATLEMETIPVAPPPPGLEVAVKVRGVSKHFGKGEQRVTALDRVDWDVYKGQFSLIIGPSGCGKTTLLNVIGGFLKPTSGEVIVEGRSVRGPDPRRIFIADFRGGRNLPN